MLNIKQPKKVYIYTFPHCRRRNIDAAWMGEYFKKNGWQLTQSIKEADLLMCNSCAYVKEKEEASIKKIKMLKENKKKDALLIVCGCLPDINKPRLDTVFEGISFGPRSLDRLDKIISAKISINEVKEPNVFDICQFSRENIFDKFLLNFEFSMTFFFKVFESILKSICKALGVKNKNIYTAIDYQPAEIYYLDKDAFWIRIAEGCLSSCTYCIERFATGKVSSKPLEEIIGVFQEGLNKGYKKFSLIATDCGAYGQDIGLDLHTLLKRIFECEGDYRISVLDVHPKWLIGDFERLKKLLKANEDKIDYINFPVQSVSERVLKMMNREYTMGELKPKLIELKKEIPSLKLITHIIVGFPGETEKDFHDTLDFIKNFKFEGVFFNKCTEGNNTLASQMPNRIPRIIKDKRLLQARLFYKKQVLFGGKK